MIESRIGLLDLDAAVEGYLRHREFLRHDDPAAVSDAGEPDEAAWDALETAIRHAPAPVAWELVVTLLRRAPDERLDFYAAGPLEELVVHRAVDIIDRIEAESRRDARFRACGSPRAPCRRRSWPAWWRPAAAPSSHSSGPGGGRRGADGDRDQSRARSSPGNATSWNERCSAPFWNATHRIKAIFI